MISYLHAAAEKARLGEAAWAVQFAQCTITTATPVESKVLPKLTGDAREKLILLSCVPIGAMPDPDPLKLHPYRYDMRLNALIWRALRHSSKQRETALDALMQAVTYREFHKEMVVRKAGAI